MTIDTSSGAGSTGTRQRSGERGRVGVVLLLWAASVMLAGVGPGSESIRADLSAPLRVAAFVALAGAILLLLAIVTTLVGLGSYRPWAWPVAIAGLWLLTLLGGIDVVTRLPAIFIPLLGIAALVVLWSLPRDARRLQLPGGRLERRSALAVAGLYVLALAVPQAGPFAGSFVDGWSAGPPLRVGLTQASAAVADGYVYVIGAPAEVGTIPASSTFLQVLDVGNAPRVPPPNAAWVLGTVDQTGKVAMAAGTRGPLYSLSPDGALLIFQPPLFDGPSEKVDKGGLSQGPALPGVHSDAALAVSADGPLLVFGGVGWDGTGKALSGAEVYSFDPRDERWTTGSPLSQPRQQAAAVAARNGLIYVLGGTGAQGPSESFPVEVYDPSTDRWSTGASLDRARWGHAAAEGRDGRIYLFGGWVQNGSSGGGATAALDVDVYDPLTDLWSKWVAPSDRPRLRAAAVTAPNGLIYLIGGGDDEASWRRVDIFATPQR